MRCSLQIRLDTAEAWLLVSYAPSVGVWESPICISSVTVIGLRMRGALILGFFNEMNWTVWLTTNIRHLGLGTLSAWRGVPPLG